MSLQRPRKPVSHRAAPWIGVLAALTGLIPAAQAAPSYALLGHPAPDFALRSAKGVNVRLSEHRGEVVVLSFWSSSCVPCWRQLEFLDQTLQTYHSAGVQIYGVSVDDDQYQARTDGARSDLDFALLLDPKKEVSERYVIDNLPMTVLIDRSGTIRYVLRDYSAKSESLYVQWLRSLLDE